MENLMLNFELINARLSASEEHPVPTLNYKCIDIRIATTSQIISPHCALKRNINVCWFGPWNVAWLVYEKHLIFHEYIV